MIEIVFAGLLAMALIGAAWAGYILTRKKEASE
jgi:predicted DNA-binding transcriptional regulator